VHAVQRGPLVPLAVSPRIVSAPLDDTASADLTVEGAWAVAATNEEESQWAGATTGR
jgi:hypothetical protein